MKAWILSLVLFAVNCSAATYYIDYASGADTNAGTAKSAPWKRHPYQSTFTGKYTHAAGDRFIFKGGVTWPAAAGRIVMAAGGSSTAGNDYYGVDQTWYSGASWTRPVFDAEYTNGGCIAVQSNSYVTIDNLEAKRALCPSDNWACISMDTGSNVLIQNCYVHGWRTSSTSDGNHGGIIVAHFSAGSDTIIIDNTEVENSENIGIQMNGQCVSRVGTIRNGSRIHDNSSLVAFCLDFGGPEGLGYAPSELFNGFGNTFDGAYHTNGIYLDPQAFGTGFTAGYIRNSYLHDIYGGANMAYPNPRASTICIYNNVMYGSMSAQLAINIDVGSYSTEAAGRVKVFNNTIMNFNSGAVAVHLGQRVMDFSSPNTPFHYTYPNGHYMIVSAGTTDFTKLGAANNNPGTTFTSNSTPPAGTGKVTSYLESLEIYNNHIINAASLTDANTAVVKTLSSGTNLLQTSAVATTQGYQLGNRFAPTSGGSTVDSGTSGISPFVKDILNHNRPQGSRWDIGAYEYGGLQSVIAPSAATIVIVTL